MNEEQKTQITKKESKRTPRKQDTKLSANPLATAIVGKFTTFYCTIGSGINTIDGVPMTIFADPDGRHVIQLFSSDGARAFLYLDQVASFHTQAEVPEVPVKQQAGFNFDMNEGPPTDQSGNKEYYQPIGQRPGQPVDEVYYRSGRGRAVPRRTERTSE